MTALILVLAVLVALLAARAAILLLVMERDVAPGFVIFSSLDNAR